MTRGEAKERASICKTLLRAKQTHVERKQRQRDEKEAWKNFLGPDRAKTAVRRASANRGELKGGCDNQPNFNDSGWGGARTKIIKRKKKVNCAEGKKLHKYVP